MVKQKLSRKDFVRLSLAFGAAAGLTACGASAPAAPTSAPANTTAKPTEAPKATGAATTAPAAGATTAPAAGAATAAPAAKTTTKPSDEGAIVYKPYEKFVVDTKPAKFAQSPVLDEKVKSGALPPVEKRLPEEPCVIRPYEGKIGTYGGNIRTLEMTTDLLGGDMAQASGQSVQLALRVNSDLKSWEPNVCKDVVVTDDNKTFTLHMRKGMKWSTGEPLTSADFKFWYDDILQNKELTPAISPYFRANNKLMEVTTPDDLTIVIKFDIPQPAFVMTVLAHRQGAPYKNNFFHPKAFLSKYHPKYTPTANDDAKAAKFNSWFERFGDLADYKRTKDLPTLLSIMCAEVSPTQTKWVRNPYFFQVDTEGNQLPYVDTFEQEFVQSLEMYTAKIVTGGVDFAAFQTNVLNYAAYNNGAAAGNYRVQLWQTGKGSEVFYQVNLTTKDESLRKLHQDLRYRKALSYAINREEINQLIYFGRATPRSMTVLPVCSYYNAEYEKAFTEYSPAKANALLDELGLKWDAAHKVRLREDGKPMQISWDFVETETPKGPVTELVTEFFRAVGIEQVTKSITRQLLGPRVLANDEPMFLWHGDAVTDILLPIDRKWSVGKYGDDCGMAPAWTQWLDTAGSQGEEPPQWFKDVRNNFEQFKNTLDKSWADKMLKSSAENLWSIGTVGLAPHPVVLRNTIQNVVPIGIWTWDDLWTYPYHAETWYHKK